MCINIGNGEEKTIIRQVCRGFDDSKVDALNAEASQNCLLLPS